MTMIPSHPNFNEDFRAIQEETDLILKERAESWSEKFPFGVFYVKNLQILSCFDEKIKEKFSCQGFFSSQEMANKAVTRLRKEALIHDRIFTKAIDHLTLDLIGKYKIANGFTDPFWWSRKE